MFASSGELPPSEGCSQSPSGGILGFDFDLQKARGEHGCFHLWAIRVLSHCFCWQDDSSFLAVTAEPEAARNLIKSSPLIRTIIEQDTSDLTHPDPSAWSDDINIRGRQSSLTAAVNPLPTDETLESIDTSEQLDCSHRTFTLHIFRGNQNYSHVDAVRVNPLHGQWPDSNLGRTFMSEALYRVVPAGAMAPALRDWETGHQLSRYPRSFAGEASEGASAVLLGKRRSSSRETLVMARVQQRRDEKEIPEIMKSLASFADKHNTSANNAGRACDAPSQSRLSEELARPESTTANARAPTPTPTARARSKNTSLLDDTAFKQLLTKSK
ncbi:hypothetical protein GGR56DRAFT_591815 [Xylariaceae sp. FL0804]|nr:hypothetical protein GGR56DRAFT_591815 [Xylariaceae sp. FL0804]